MRTKTDEHILFTSLVKVYRLARKLGWKLSWNRIAWQRRTFWSSLNLFERIQLSQSISPFLKTVELDAVIFVRTGQGAELRRCLSKGASPDLKGLMYNAICTGNAGAVEILLSSGADPNKTMGGGDTYLHAAASAGETAIIESLISRGADPNRKNRTGATAFYCARDNGRIGAITILEPLTESTVTYRVEEFLKIEDPVEAYFALCSAIRKDFNRRYSPVELRVLSLNSFFTFCWPNGFSDMYWQATWAVIPCAEWMEAIGETTFSALLQKCISIVREYGQRVGRNPFQPETDYVELDMQVESQLNAPELCFFNHDYDEKVLCRKTMDYVRKNESLFGELAIQEWNRRSKS